MNINAIILTTALLGTVTAGLAQQPLTVTLDGHAINMKSSPAANKRVAASLQTDADIAFKGVRVPKGSYTVYVLTDGPQYVLTVNKATGAKASTYDAKLDLGKLNMVMSKGDATPACQVTLTKAAALAAKFAVACNGTVGTAAFKLDRGGNDSEW